MKLTPNVDAQLIRTMLGQIGENIERPGLRETPKRVAKAWGDWMEGYAQDPASILKLFPHEGDAYDQMVFQSNIPVYSHCEHHMAPFFGVAHLAYIPGPKGIVGLSKLGQLVDCFAHRLQVQERLTKEIADALNEHLEPMGVAVVLRCRHMCMESRGNRQRGTTGSTSTSAMTGAFFDNPSTRAEFFQLVASNEQPGKL